MGGRTMTQSPKCFYCCSWIRHEFKQNSKDWNHKHHSLGLSSWTIAVLVKLLPCHITTVVFIGTEYLPKYSDMHIHSFWFKMFPSVSHKFSGLPTRMCSIGETGACQSSGSGFERTKHLLHICGVWEQAARATSSPASPWLLSALQMCVEPQVWSRADVPRYQPASRGLCFLSRTRLATPWGFTIPREIPKIPMGRERARESEIKWGGRMHWLSCHGGWPTQSMKWWISRNGRTGGKM